MWGLKAPEAGGRLGRFSPPLGRWATPASRGAEGTRRLAAHLGARVLGAGARDLFRGGQLPRPLAAGGLRRLPAPLHSDFSPPCIMVPGSWSSEVRPSVDLPPEGPLLPAPGTGPSPLWSLILGFPAQGSLGSTVPQGMEWALGLPEKAQVCS